MHHHRHVLGAMLQHKSDDNLIFCIMRPELDYHSPFHLTAFIAASCLLICQFCSFSVKTLLCHFKVKSLLVSWLLESNERWVVHQKGIRISEVLLNLLASSSRPSLPLPSSNPLALQIPLVLTWDVINVCSHTDILLLAHVKSLFAW